MHPSQRFQEFHTDKNIFPPQQPTKIGHPVGCSPSAMTDLATGPNDKLNGCRSTLNNTVSNQPEEPLSSRLSSKIGYWDQSSCSNSHLNASGEIPKLSSNLQTLVENLQNRFLDPRTVSIGVEGQVCFQENSNKQEHCVAYRGLDSINISIDGGKLPKVHEGQGTENYSQNQSKINSGCAGGFGTNNAVKDDTRIEKTLSSSAPSLIPCLKEESSVEKFETDLSTCGNDQKSKVLTDSIKAKKTKVCNASEKLWNGTLQLSSSAKLSAAAYFRSGDKMPDIYWSDSVEVKGKVRLEAFEKYIKDLPRSRSRGLMVISLRLTEGSSKEGLKGMKEELKKYKTGKRIGRANLSPGVDIYICPNTKPIITILSNNGFSKGLVSVEDPQDSLIGCAVWRKNSSSEPNPQQVTESDSSAKAEDKAPAIHGIVGNTSGENKNTESSSSPSDIHAIHSIVKQLTEIEASIFRSLGVEKPQGNLQLLSTILPSASEAVKHSDPNTEDDDLPEYDFGAAILHGPKNDLMAPTQIQMCVETQMDLCGVSLPQKRKPQIADPEPSKLPIQDQANKTRNLFDEDDMPEWKPPQFEVALPPPPQPFGHAGRPQNMPYKSRDPNNHNGWRRQ